MFDELPCDDLLLDEAETVARAGLQSAGSCSGAFAARPRSRAGTVSAWSSASAPSLDGTYDTSRPGSRPGTGRFTNEELACFRRVQYTPSSLYSNKDMSGIIIGDMAGMLKRSASEGSSPMSKSSRLFRRLPTEQQLQATLQNQRRQLEQHVTELPEEALTAKVLDEIYPRSVLSEQESPTPLESVTHQRRNANLMSQSMVPVWRGSLKKAATVANVADASKGRGDVVRPVIATQQLTPKSLKQDVSTPSAQRTLKAMNTLPSPGSPLNASNFNSTSGAGGLNGEEFRINMKSSSMEMMRQFRTFILEKCSSIHEVLDMLASEVPPGTPLTKTDWRRSLAKLGLELGKDERETLFKQVDRDGDGLISVSEVQFLLEAAAPIKSLTGLRRRWLASGYATMCAALKTMEEGGFNVHRRLSLREFGEALVRVNVSEHNEHMALFNIIMDPSDHKSRVTIGDLMCAVATVSPSLLLEEIRDRLIKRYHGSIGKAYYAIDSNHDGGLSYKEFVEKCYDTLDMTVAEAEKAFRMIDVDNSGCITRVEFVSAFAMSEPSLFLEDLRHKVQQRFRSIKDAFAQSIEQTHLHEGGDPSAASVKLPRFQSILSGVSMSEVDTRVLFELVDADGNGALTFGEFLKATRQLAPSCAFENLRLLCLNNSAYICESFAPWAAKRSEKMSFQVFSEMLGDLNLASDVESKVIFDVLDVKNEGVVTISRLIAALQAGGPGRHVRLTKDEQTYKAEQEIKSSTATLRKLAGDLKTDVRLGSRGDSPVKSRTGVPKIDEEDEEFGAHDGRHTARTQNTARTHNSEKNSAKSSPKSKRGWGVQALFAPNRGAKLLAQLHRAQSKDSAQTRQGAGPEKQQVATPDKFGSPQQMNSPSSQQDNNEPLSDSSSPKHRPPRLRTVPDHETKFHIPLVAPKRGSSKSKVKSSLQQPKKHHEKCIDDNQQSWDHVWKRLNETDGTDDREAIERSTFSYFQTATWRLSHDGPLLEQSPSRLLCHMNIRAHHSALFK